LLHDARRSVSHIANFWWLAFNAAIGVTLFRLIRGFAQTARQCRQRYRELAIVSL
jgi:hypothetical protein